jgi:tight adherence protein B
MIHAKASEARMTAYILGALPFVMFVIISISSPGYTAPLYEDPRGQKMALVGIAWMGLGGLWLRNMVRFDF